MTYPVVFLGRAQDIANVQELLTALDAAIAHERSIQDAEASMKNRAVFSGS